MADCLFCRIAAGQAKADIVYEDRDIVAFNDINPRAPLHVLVVPRRHIDSLAEADDASLVGKLALVGAKIAKDAGYAERGFRVAANAGPEGGQAIPHLHFHVIAGRRLGPPA